MQLFRISNYIVLSNKYVKNYEIYGKLLIRHKEFDGESPALLIFANAELLIFIYNIVLHICSKKILDLNT